MTVRPSMRALLVGVVLLVTILAIWRYAGRDPSDPEGTDPAAPAVAPTDAELERIRAEIEAERAAEARRAAGDAATGRLLARASDFSHAQHRDVNCLQCHSMSDAHGTLRVTDARQCQECHHTQPLAATCTNCHREADFRGERLRMQLAFSPSVGGAATREILFAHAQHGSVSCTSCHTTPVTQAVTVGCTDCHEQHHRPENQCMACHTAPPRAAHTVLAHLGCSSSGCHSPLPAAIARVPRTRNFCLACHQELVDHERGANCADCHQLPPPRSAAAAGPSLLHGNLP
jgi:hypothetical protein